LPQQPPKLSAQQEKFCREYVLDYNGTKAAIRAKYSPKTARSQASDLLTSPNISLRISQLEDEKSARNQITVDRWVQEVAKIAFLDIKTQFQNINESGTLLKPFAELDGSVLSSVNEKRGKDGDTFLDIRFHDKTKALEMLGKHLGALEPKKENASPESTQTALSRIADALEARDG
jgi:phage terminase small subunit